MIEAKLMEYGAALIERLLFAAPVVGWYLLIVITWTLYVAAINLLPKLPTLRPIVRVHAGAVVLVAVLFDAVLNLVVATVVFFDRPRELLLTARLKRYKTGAAGAWRQKAATWICAHLLNPFDPSGDHC